MFLYLFFNNIYKLNMLKNKMRKIRKRGQMQISFGMIFSIFIIIAIIVSSFIIIKWVLKNQRCMEINLFIEDLKNEVDKSFKDEESIYTFTRSFPVSIEYICFVNSPQSEVIPENYLEEVERMKENTNMILLPIKKSCQRAYTNINKIVFEDFCIKNSGTIKIKLVKDYEDNLVRISEENE